MSRSSVPQSEGSMRNNNIVVVIGATGLDRLLAVDAYPQRDVSDECLQREYKVTAD